MVNMPYRKTGNYALMRRRLDAFKAKKAPARRYRKRVPARNYRKDTHPAPEIKSCIHNVPLQTSLRGAITLSADVLPIVPFNNQGIGTNSRIGSSIEGLTLRVMGTFIADWRTYVTDVSMAAIGVRVMIVQPKRFKHWPDSQAHFIDWLPVLLDNGVGGMPFTGDSNSYYAPINKDCVTVYRDKRFTLYPPTMLNPPQVANPNLVATPTSVKPFKFLLKVNKRLRFPAPADNAPSNYGPVMLVGWSYLNGAAPDFKNAVDMSLRSDLWFRDN